MTTFRVENGSPASGRLVYDKQYYSFGTEPRPTGCVASVSIHEVEMMLNEDDQRMVFITGYCPYQSWKTAILKPPGMRRALLYAVTKKPVAMGTTVGLHPSDESWPILVDSRSGWVRLGKGDPKEDGEGIEFAPGAVAVLENDRMVALWLRPESLPNGLPNPPS